MGVDIGIYLGNNQGNFQLHGFTRRDNTAKSFRGATFLDSHCRYIKAYYSCLTFKINAVFSCLQCLQSAQKQQNSSCI